jgi:hypothetical protein
LQLDVTRRVGQVLQEPGVDLGAFQARGILPAAARDPMSRRLGDGAKQFHPFIIAGRDVPPAEGSSIDLELGAAELPP